MNWLCKTMCRLLAAAALAMLLASGANADIVWPREWKVFLPVDREAPPLPRETLADIPERIEIAGQAIEGRWIRAQDVREMHGRPIALENVQMDFAPLFGEVQPGNTAYAFLPIESAEARRAVLGMGADWWMQVWLNGELIVDTTVAGNQSWPARVNDHTAEVQLRQGRNVLAVRFVSGSGSSMLVVGGPRHLAAVERLKDAAFPEPDEDQAYATAKKSVRLDLPDADFSAGALAGVQAMPPRQLIFAGEARPGRLLVRDREYPRFDAPVRLLLSKSQYPAEDRHLDAIVWLTPEEADAEPGGRVELTLRDAQGRTLAEGRLDDPARSGVFFSMGLPPALVGAEGRLEARWVRGGEVLGSAERRFEVLPAADVPRSGRIALTIPNDTGATVANAPMTVGVPFPRGALLDDANVRLVDEEGREMPLQTRITARWSRFGPIQWILCDFTADLAGGPRHLHLEYGPQVARADAEAIRVENEGGRFPQIEAGRLGVSPLGVAFDVLGDGHRVPLLRGGALLGAFVQHEDGKEYLVPADVRHDVEEAGTQKVVVRRTGWYAEPDTGDKFCNFVTRMVFHRDSPVARIYHTWIFTGNGNHDRIAQMGWRFPLAAEASPDGFLSSFEDGQWLRGGHLVQFDHSAFEVEGAGEHPGGRAAGVLGARVGAGRVMFGAKDFWQNFPSELAFEDGGFVFYNWPRRNPKATFSRPVGVWEAFRHRFAHEGEVLDFRLPDEYAEEPIWAAMSARRPASSHYALNRPESANAQGIARTEEMFLYFGDAAEPPDEAARVMQGLNDETLRPAVDPAWVAASGAFGRIRHRDVEKYAEDERIYEEVCLAPMRWIERLGVYGMWIYGGVPAWDMRLPAKESGPYRAYRKNHHGWPIRWVPYARSGDPKLLKIVQTTTRQMADANFCHYASDDVDMAVGGDYERRQGWWNRSILPWAGLPHGQRGPGTRFYAVESDYLWHSYYMTGCRRGKDVALLFGERVQFDRHPIVTADRVSQSCFSTYMTMYQATFDPWFLAGFHALAEMYMASERWRDGFWRPAERDYVDFTGCEEFKQALLQRIHPERIFWGHEQGGGWGGRPPGIATRFEPHAVGWHLTGDEYYLRRLAHEVDRANMSVYEGEIDYWRGYTTRGSRGTNAGSFTGWYIQHFPLALHAFESAGHRPDPAPSIFAHESPYSSETVQTEEGRLYRQRQPEIAFLKEEGRPLPLVFNVWRSDGGGEYEYAVVGPDGAEALAGTWELPGRKALEVPAEAPAGVYRLRMEGMLIRRHRAHMLYQPVAHRDVPEVVVLEASEGGTSVPPAQAESQYWFRVPEGVEEFWAEFPVMSDEVRRITVWNPDMERAWDFHYYEPEYDGPRPVRAEVRVPPEHAGKLWRITKPNHDGFRLDPQIPPVFSTSRGKWFDPEDR